MENQRTDSFASKAGIYEILAWLLFLGLLANGAKGMSAVLGPVDVKAVSSAEFFNAIWRALALTVPTFMMAWAVLDLAYVFGRCGKGEIFTQRNVKSLKVSGLSLFAAALVSAMIAPSLLAWLDGQPRGFLWVTDNLSLGVAAIGIVLFGFADILAKAVDIKEENDEMI